MVMRMSLRSGEIVTCGGSTGKSEIALVQVVGADALHIAFQLFAGVFIGAGVPGQPTRRGQLEHVQQIAFGEGLVADEADFLDTCNGAFEHVEAHAHAVARQGRHGGRHLDAVLALGQVLLLQFVFGALEHGAVENAAFGKTHLRQRSGNGLGIELAHAVEVHGGDRRALLHDHDHDVVVGLDLHVGEETRAVQAADGFRRLFFSELSPTLTGRYPKTVPASVRWILLRGYPARQKGRRRGRWPVAVVRRRSDPAVHPFCDETSGEKTSLSILGRANGGGFYAKSRLSKQTREIVEQRKPHQACQ